VLLAVWPDRPGELGATLPSVGLGSAFVYELLLTAFLIAPATGPGIMAVATDTRAVRVCSPTSSSAGTARRALAGGGSGDSRGVRQALEGRVHVGLGELRVLELAGEVALVGGHVEVAVA
jgi:hypothetical protein